MFCFVIFEFCYLGIFLCVFSRLLHFPGLFTFLSCLATCSSHNYIVRNKEFRYSHFCLCFTTLVNQLFENIAYQKHYSTHQTKSYFLSVIIDFVVVVKKISFGFIFKRLFGYQIYTLQTAKRKSATRTL